MFDDIEFARLVQAITIGKMADRTLEEVCEQHRIALPPPGCSPLDVIAAAEVLPDGRPH